LFKLFPIYLFWQSKQNFIFATNYRLYKIIPPKLINSWCWTVVFPIPTDLIELKTMGYIRLSAAPSSGKYYDILINNNSVTRRWQRLLWMLLAWCFTSLLYCRQRTYAEKYPKGLEFKLILILPINIKQGFCWNIKNINYYLKVN
jgi:hypothetical protein